MLRLQLFRVPCSITRVAGRARCISNSAYNTAVSKWGLEGIPQPKSLSILEDDSAPIDLSEDSAAVDGARPGTPPVHLRSPSGKPTPHEYRAHRDTLRKSFPSGWAPPKKLSREAMDALRQLHATDPGQFSTALLAEKFRVSPEAVRRILKSKWEPGAERRTRMAIREREERERWRRGVMDKEVREMDALRALRSADKQERKMGRRAARQRGEEDGGEEEREDGREDGFTFQ